MDNILLPQETYDKLIKRLNANHHGHKSQSPFDDIRRRIERDARIEKFGVCVPQKLVKIAYSAIETNVALVGKKYQSGGDQLLLLDLDEAISNKSRELERWNEAEKLEDEADSNGLEIMSQFKFPEII